MKKSAPAFVLVAAVASLGLGQPARAADPRFPICAAPIRALLDSWEKRRHWETVSLALGEPTVLRTPTRRIGEWLEARVAPDSITIARASDRQIAQARFAPGLCAVRVTVTARHYDPRRMNDAFTDEYLRRILRLNHRGILYSWSPHMPFSIERVDAIEKAAAQLGLKVFFVLDPYADENLAQREAREYGLGPAALRRMQSLELFNRGMLIHFPSILVFSDQRIQGSIVPGWKTDVAYVQFVKERLGE
jgi:hypothetical protein